MEGEKLSTSNYFQCLCFVGVSVDGMDGGAQIFQWEKSLEKKNKEQRKRRRKIVKRTRVSSTFGISSQEEGMRTLLPGTTSNCKKDLPARRRREELCRFRQERRGRAKPARRSKRLCCTKARKQTCSTISRPSISLLVVLSGNLLPPHLKLPAPSYCSPGQKSGGGVFQRGIFFYQTDEKWSRRLFIVGGGADKKKKLNQERRAMLEIVVMGGHPSSFRCCCSVLVCFFSLPR